jgi:glycosyltransferase involved in cell wall biosynthesis
LAGPDVAFSGAVPDLRPWLEQAAVYAAPMMSGTGLKNKVLEAMAAGLPVVASPLALAGIGAGDGVTEASDLAGMAGALAALLADPERRRAAGVAGRHRVERDFTWEANAAAVARLWEELLESAPPASRDR